MLEKLRKLFHPTTESEAIAKVLVDALRKAEAEEGHSDDDDDDDIAFKPKMSTGGQPRLTRPAARKFIADMDKFYKKLNAIGRDCFRHIIYNCTYQGISTTYFCGMGRSINSIVRSENFSARKLSVDDFKALQATGTLNKKQIYNKPANNSVDVCEITIANPVLKRTSQIIYFHIFKIDDHKKDLEVTEDELDEYVYN